MGQVSFSLLRWLQFFFCFVLLVFFFFYRREVSSAGFPEYQEFQFLSVEFLTPSFLALEFRQAGKYITGIFKIILLPAPPKRQAAAGMTRLRLRLSRRAALKSLIRKDYSSSFLFFFLTTPRRKHRGF